MAVTDLTATLVVETTPTEITYNGDTIATLEAGHAATLQCANKKAASDIVATFGAAGTITYNGTETAVEAGQTATMECLGKKMLSDVVIAVGALQNDVKLLTADGYALTDANGLLITTKEDEESWQ